MFTCTFSKLMNIRPSSTLVEFPIPSPNTSYGEVLGNLLVGVIFVAIMAMAIPALLGVDPTNLRTPPVPTEVHKN